MMAFSGPDWGFFSPQNDPFKQAFDIHTALRQKSVDKLQTDKKYLREQ
jgi:hypothetical protein